MIFIIVLLIFIIVIYSHESSPFLGAVYCTDPTTSQQNPALCKHVNTVRFTVSIEHALTLYTQIVEDKHFYL